MKTVLRIFFISLMLFGCGSANQSQNPNTEEQQLLNSMKSSIADTTDMEIVLERDTTH